MTTDLDSFESRLLADLRAEVAERAAAGAAAPRRDGPGAGRRRLAAVLAAAAAVVAAAVAVPALVGPSPAYAVGDGPGGTIEVEIDRLEDAAGLEQALEDEGVAADVQYLGTDLQCQDDRYRYAPSAPGSRTTFEVGTGGLRVVLDRRDVVEGRTVVIAASTTSPGGVDENGIEDLGGAYSEVGIARGPVAPCEPELNDSPL